MDLFKPYVPLIYLVNVIKKEEKKLFLLPGFKNSQWKRKF